MPPRKLPPFLPRPRAFSLVEVMMSLGIIAFAFTALLGAFAVGMHTDRESIEELQATHILQSIIAERRAAPTLSDTNFLLPPLDAAAARESEDAIALTEIGRRPDGGQPGKFALLYRVAPNSTTNSSALYCAIYWPGQASPENAQGRVEMTTRIPLP